MARLPVVMIRGEAPGVLNPAYAVAAVSGERRSRVTAFDANEAESPAGGALSHRELEVLALVAEGWTNAQVGEALHLSHWTIKRHVSRMLRKLGLSRRIELAVWYDRRDPIH